MAASDGERRMVFDIRGRRRHVVKFVYAILALLMGASLFLVVGPVNINSLLGGGSSTSNVAAPLEEQAERIERKLKKDPEDPDLLLSLTRARIGAGNALAVINSETGGAEITVEGRQQLEKGSQAWSEYLKASDEPTAGGAQIAAPMLFSLAQTSRNGPEIEVNMHAAARAQQIVAEQRPSLGSLSTLAIYQLYSFDYAGAKRSRQEAITHANTKFERENLENELDKISKSSHEFQGQLKKLEKEVQQKNKGQGNGEPSIPNPLAEGNPLAAP